MVQFDRRKGEVIAALPNAARTEIDEDCPLALEHANVTSQLATCRTRVKASRSTRAFPVR